MDKKFIMTSIIHFIDYHLLNQSKIKPVIFLAIENDLYDITILLLKKICSSNEILIKNGNINHIKNENFDHLVIEMNNKNDMNYYPLILRYLSYKKIRNKDLYLIGKYIFIILFLSFFYLQ